MKIRYGYETFKEERFDDSDESVVIHWNQQRPSAVFRRIGQKLAEMISGFYLNADSIPIKELHVITKPDENQVAVAALDTDTGTLTINPFHFYELGMVPDGADFSELKEEDLFAILIHEDEHFHLPEEFGALDRYLDEALLPLHSLVELSGKKDLPSNLRFTRSGKFRFVLGHNALVPMVDDLVKAETRWLETQSFPPPFQTLFEQRLQEVSACCKGLSDMLHCIAANENGTLPQKLLETVERSMMPQKAAIREALQSVSNDKELWQLFKAVKMMGQNYITHIAEMHCDAGVFNSSFVKAAQQLHLNCHRVYGGQTPESSDVPQSKLEEALSRISFPRYPSYRTRAELAEAFIPKTQQGFTHRINEESAQRSKPGTGINS